MHDLQAEDITINCDPKERLKKITCFALDMDGTIYLGRQWIEGAREFLDAVTAKGKEYVFVTNNSSKNAAVYVEKLRCMGLDTGPEKIITSGQATIAYLNQHFSGKRVFLMGNDLLKEEFAQAGVNLCEERPDLVVTAFDTSLDYAKLCKVCDYVRSGMPYLATHPDYNCPTETGMIPDIGSFHELIHASAFRYPDRIIGKPNKEIMDYLIKRTGAVKETTAMVGDRLYTDVAAGVHNGFTGILVLSGEARLTDVKESAVQPHLIFDSVRQMIPYL